MKFPSSPPSFRHRLGIGLLLLAPLLGFASIAPAIAPDRPNIVYILADDLGIGDLRSFNPNSKIPTPRLDTLAAQGRIFTDAHSSCAVCTPTRYGLLTGRYSWRSEMKSGVLNGYSPPLIPASRMTVASLLKSHGYATAAVGKWHLGWDWPTNDANKPGPTNLDYAQPIRRGPLALGFDEFFGIPASLDMPPYLYIENDRPAEPATRTVSDQKAPGFYRGGPASPGFRHEEVLLRLTERAVKIIDAQSKRDAANPLFLYLALAAPHTPVLPRPPFQGLSKIGPYGDFVCEVDWAVGQIIDALERNGMTTNTLLIFTSDNGFAPMADSEELRRSDHKPSYIYRGTKADIFEGGHRMPFIAHWPGVVPAGTSCADTICLNDLLATAADLLHADLPPGAGEDSFSMLPALKGIATKPTREATVHQSSNGSLAIRQGPWKLIFCKDSGGWSPPRPEEARTMDLPPVQLYNLETDPAEQHNLQSEHADIVKRLTELMRSYLDRGRSTPGPAQTMEGPVSFPF